MAVDDALARARVLADLGRYDDADPVLAQVLAAEPDNEQALSLLGYGLIQRFRWAEAEQTLGHAGTSLPATKIPSAA